MLESANMISSFCSKTQVFDTTSVVTEVKSSNSNETQQFKYIKNDGGIRPKPRSKNKIYYYYVKNL